MVFTVDKFNLHGRHISKIWHPNTPHGPKLNSYHAYFYFIIIGSPSKDGLGHKNPSC